MYLIFFQILNQMDKWDMLKFNGKHDPNKLKMISL